MAKKAKKRKPRLGSGGRFKAGVAKLTRGKRKVSVARAKGIMAAAGRAKYGKSRFQKMAVKGRRRRK